MSPDVAVSVRSFRQCSGSSHLADRTMDGAAARPLHPFHKSGDKAILVHEWNALCRSSAPRVRGRKPTSPPLHKCHRRVDTYY